MIGSKKKARRLPSALGIAFAVALVFGAFAAASAQASTWHILGKEEYNGKPIAGYIGTGGIPPHGTFKMEVPQRKVLINCTPKTSGYIWAQTKLYTEITLRYCAVTSLADGKPVPCEQEEPENEPLKFIYEGTGDSISISSASGLLQFKGMECPLSSKTAITLPSTLPLTWGVEANWEEPTSSGTGKFGLFPMNVTARFKWGYAEGLPPWGWY